MSIQKCSGNPLRLPGARMGQTIAYLDCHSGISGDMFLGAAIDAGLPLETLTQALAALPLTGYELKCERFVDKGIHGTQISVVMHDHEQPTRHLSDIVALLQGAALAPRVRETACAIFRCLAEAEASVHGTSIEEVHFHEVGAIDAIVDITGAAIAINSLGITQLYASSLPLTTGHVKTAHGLLPVPAPATLELLRKVQAPWQPRDIEGELVTPTGAAILATLARFDIPPIAIKQIGYGFGQKRLPWPNCLRLCIGQTLALEGGAADTDWVTVIESNIDNMSGELLGGLMQQLLAYGALDVSYTPIQMKKNRPAIGVTVICALEEGERFASLLLQETSTLGVRIQQVQRRKAQRTHMTVETPIGPIRVKIKRLGTQVISASPEYDSCQQLAQERGIPLQTVYELAQQTIQTNLLVKRH